MAIARAGTPVEGTSTSTTALALSYTPAATGNFLAFWIHSRNGTGSAVSSVTDDGDGGGSTWVAGFNVNFAGSRTMALFYTLSAAANITTITANLGASSLGDNYGVIAEYSGVSAKDAGPSTSVAGTGTSFTTNAISPTGSDLELAMFSVFDFTTWTITSPFAQVHQGSVPSFNDTILAADQINANTTTANATKPDSATADAYLITFSPVGVSTTWPGYISPFGWR